MIEKVLYESEIELLPSVRKWPDAAICVLTLVKSLLYPRTMPSGDEAIRCWYFEHIHRLFWGNQTKTIHSLQVPFIIEVDEEKNVIVKTSHNIMLIHEYFDELLCLFQSIKEHNQCLYSIEGLDNEFSDMLQQYQIQGQKQKEELWKCFCILSTFEPGYIRYDCDAERECGRKHPHHHLDVNFEKNGSFKIGLVNQISINDFSDIIDLSTDCYFLKQLSY